MTGGPGPGPVVSMSRGSGAPSLEGPSEESGSGEWRRIYNRVEALLPRVEKLAADRARHELSEARENALHARLLQAEASRKRWKTAYIDLPLLANPKIPELKKIDSKDYTCEDDGNSNDDNLQLKAQLKEATSSVELRQNNEDNEVIARDLRAELRKLKQAYETLSSNKEKELCALLGVKDFLWNQLRTIDKDTTLLKTKEVEVVQASEEAQKLQKNIEELQLAAQHKDNEIGRLRAEGANAKKRVLILDGKLLEMHSLVKEKNDEIQKLKNIKEVEATQATEAAQKLQKNIEELQVTARKKDDEIGRFRAEAVDAENKLMAMEKDHTTLLKIKEVEGAQATEATDKLQKNMEEIQEAARDKDDEIRRLQAEALATKNKLLVVEDEIQKLIDGQLESLKRKRASISNESSQKRRMDTNEMDLEQHTEKAMESTEKSAGRTERSAGKLTNPEGAADAPGTSLVKKNKEVFLSTTPKDPPASDEDPFMRLMMDCQRCFVQVVSERDQLRESLSQTEAERDNASRRANDLEKNLKALEKESQAALDQAIAEARELKEKLEVRLHTAVEALSGVTGASLDPKGRDRVDPLTDAAAALEGCGEQMQGLLDKVKEALERLHESVFPKADPPQTLGELVEVFCADQNPLVGYSRAQAQAGAEATLLLAMGHGIKGDFRTATSSFPIGADGKEVDLNPFARQVRKLSKRLVALVERRYTEQSERSRRGGG